MRLAVVVAHPDDEVLFAGGLLAANPGAVVFCCTTPRRDPVRIEKFHEACAVFGAVPVIVGGLEPKPRQPITDVPGFDFSGYDMVVTHNAAGEYGNEHHRSLHALVPSTHVFGYGLRLTETRLSDEAAALKARALRCYNHVTPIDGKPKWQALIDRYFDGDETQMQWESYAIRR